MQAHFPRKCNGSLLALGGLHRRSRSQKGPVGNEDNKVSFVPRDGLRGFTIRFLKTASCFLRNRFSARVDRVLNYRRQERFNKARFYNSAVTRTQVNTQQSVSSGSDGVLRSTAPFPRAAPAVRVGIYTGGVIRMCARYWRKGRGGDMSIHGG